VAVCKPALEPEGLLDGFGHRDHKVRYSLMGNGFDRTMICLAGYSFVAVAAVVFAAVVEAPAGHSP